MMLPKLFLISVAGEINKLGDIRPFLKELYAFIPFISLIKLAFLLMISEESQVA